MLDVIGAGLSIAGGIAGFGASKDAAKAAKRLMRRKLWQHQMDSAFNISQQEKAGEQALGYIDASIGASNILFSGSAMSYRSEVKTQLRQELTNLKRTAALEAEMIQLGGEAEAKSIKNQGTMSLLGGFSNAIGMF